MEPVSSADRLIDAVCSLVSDSDAVGSDRVSESADPDAVSEGSVTVTVSDALTDRESEYELEAVPVIDSDPVWLCSSVSEPDWLPVGDHVGLCDSLPWENVGEEEIDTVSLPVALASSLSDVEPDVVTVSDPPVAVPLTEVDVVADCEVV